MNKKLIAIILLILLVMIFIIFNLNEKTTEKEVAESQDSSSREVVFTRLGQKKKPEEKPKPEEVAPVKVVETRSFEEIQTNLEESTQKCRGSIDQLLPGEDKTEELPDDPEVLEKVLASYLDSDYGKQVFSINSFIAGKQIPKKELENFITKQEENQQCYPFVEQEILLKMLDEITEDDADPNLKDKYKTIVLDYICKAVDHPQSLFHMASYLNIIQVFSENNLVDNRFQFELERLRGEIMTTVRDTDEDLIKSLRESEMTNFVEVHKRRFESTDKIKTELSSICKEMKQD